MYVCVCVCLQIHREYEYVMRPRTPKGLFLSCKLQAVSIAKRKCNPGSVQPPSSTRKTAVWKLYATALLKDETENRNLKHQKPGIWLSKRTVNRRTPHPCSLPEGEKSQGDLATPPRICPVWSGLGRFSSRGQSRDCPVMPWARLVEMQPVERTVIRVFRVIGQFFYWANFSFSLCIVYNIIKVVCFFFLVTDLKLHIMLWAPTKLSKKQKQTFLKGIGHCFTLPWNPYPQVGAHGYSLLQASLFLNFIKTWTV